MIGDSHTRAIRKAMPNPADGTGDVEVDIHWLATEKNGVLRGDLKIEDASTMIQSLSGQDALVITLLGTAHNIVGLLQHGQPYWVCEADSDRIQSIGSNEVVPASAILDMFEHWYRRNKRVLQLKSWSNVRVFHLMTPPPKQDSEFIRASAERYSDGVVVAPADLRARLWRLEMQILGKLCEEWGMGLVPPPPESVCTGGFLHRNYYAHDATHANEAYGELVLRQIERIALNQEM